MYSIFFPPEATEDYMRLEPGEVIHTVASLHQMGPVATPSNYSIHAVASGDVQVDVFMSNFMIENPDSSAWMPCPSIPSFKIKAGENLFFQNAFEDTCGYLLMRFTSLETEKNKVTACTLRLCLDSKKRKAGKVRPKPEPDHFEVTQASSLTILKSKLLENDYYETPIADIVISDIAGGTIAETKDSYIFTPTARYGEDAGFSYHLIDVEGTKSTFACRVKITINMLPAMTGYIFNTEELQLFIDSYVPPTFKEIFDSWARYANNAYYPKGTKPAGEAASWEMSGTNKFRCTVNSNYLTGFISPEEFEYYEHQADISSTDGDDDCIALLIAFARIGANNHSLLLYRESGGMPGQTGRKGFALVYVINNQYTTIKQPNTNKCWSGSPRENQGSYGWNRTSPTRCKVIRDGNIIQVLSSPFKSLDLTLGEAITIDLNDYPTLAWAKGPHPYGYACYSQKYSTFDNVKFSGAGALDADQVYNIDNGDVYRFVAGKWAPTGDKIWDVTGAPRIIKNIVNGKSYRIEQGSVTEIV